MSLVKFRQSEFRFGLQLRLSLLSARLVDVGEADVVEVAWLADVRMLERGLFPLAVWLVLLLQLSQSVVVLRWKERRGSLCILYGLCSLLLLFWFKGLIFWPNFLNLDLGLFYFLFNWWFFVEHWRSLIFSFILENCGFDLLKATVTPRLVLRTTCLTVGVVLRTVSENEVVQKAMLLGYLVCSTPHKLVRVL